LQQRVEEARAESERRDALARQRYAQVQARSVGQTQQARQTAETQSAEARRTVINEATVRSIFE
jgi:hypothetical protein